VSGRIPMMKALAGLEAQQSQSEFNDEFLTQKELDPDLIGFNSENRRYHFPARAYFASRGAFGQFDRRLFWLHLILPRTSAGNFKDSLAVYSYVNHKATIAVDPSGLLIKIHDKAPKGTLKAIPFKADPCHCGAGNVEAIIDADPNKKAPDPRRDAWEAKNPDKQFSIPPLGVWVYFGWDPSGGTGGKCPVPCCSTVQWHHFSYEPNGLWKEDDPRKRLEGATSAVGSGGWMTDYPGFRPEDIGNGLTAYFAGIAVCKDQPSTPYVLYTVVYGITARPDQTVQFNLWGDCGGSMILDGGGSPDPRELIKSTLPPSKPAGK